MSSERVQQRIQSKSFVSTWKCFPFRKSLSVSRLGLHSVDPRHRGGLFGPSSFTLRTGIDMVLGGGGASVFVSLRTQRRTFGQSGYIADSVATTTVYLAKTMAAERPRRQRWDSTGTCSGG